MLARDERSSLFVLSVNGYPLFCNIDEEELWLLTETPKILRQKTLKLECLLLLVTYTLV